jgi:hypothetical protein
VRTPSQGYGEDLEGNYSGEGDLQYSEDGRRGTPFSLGVNEEGNHCVVGKKDLQRLREITPTENSACMEA